jgi:LacI family transcriptional regulator
MATIREVAQHAGVGVSTVSRVIRGKGYVSSDVRQRVRSAMAELNYSPNAAAQALRGQRTNTIGLLLPDLNRLIWMGVISGAEQIADGRGYSLLVASWHSDPDKERRHLERLLARKVDGLIAFSQDRKHERIGIIKNSGVPCVMLGVGAGDFPADRVYIDLQTAAHRLTSHLLDHGHERIAAIHGPPTAGGARQRRAGYEKALQDHGLAPDPALVRFAEFSQQGGYLACLDLLRQTPRPTGLLTANGPMAFGAIHACQEQQCRIPEDLAIVTVDDVELESDLSQFLTAAAQPTHTFGRVAAQMLFDRIENAPIAGYRDVVLQAEIIVRQSCGCAGTPTLYPRDIEAVTLSEL